MFKYSIDAAEADIIRSAPVVSTLLFTVMKLHHGVSYPKALREPLDLFSCCVLSFADNQ